MSRIRSKPAFDLIEKLRGEASWLLSHAQALADYGRKQEAASELARAAKCEEQVACLLDAVGQELDAAIHRVSAAACHEKLGQFARAVTLLRAALSVPLHDDYRFQVQKQLAVCLAPAHKELRRAAKRPTSKHSRTIP